jgi:excisionase family DNA binding protein
MERNKTSTSSYLTTRQAADVLGVSLRSVQLWAESGYLSYWKTGGGHRRITRLSVENFMRTRQSLPTGPDTGVNDAAERLHVLVVEDEPTLRQLYRVKLSQWSCAPRVSEACNGFEALLKIGEQRPHLMIADLSMPEMDGFQMLRMLHAQPQMPPMSIVVVTGMTAEEIAQRGGLPDDIAVFQKPIPFARLEALADSQCEHLGWGATDFVSV